MSGALPYQEQALVFGCADEDLVGVCCVPAMPSRRAVLIVVGGPQYRAGSHRQFTLLARSLATEGIASLRFDYRGMGDSSGDARNFEQVDADLKAGVDALLAQVPGTTEVVIWGLCDAASAAMFYAGHDERVTGLVLLNPWARTPGGHAKATLRHYYVQRLLAPEFWKKVLSGRFNVAKAGASFTRMVGTAMGGKEEAVIDPAAGVPIVAAPAPSGPPLPERMLAGTTRFTGKLLLITSGNDLTAQEFMDMVNGSRKWQKLLDATRVTKQVLAEADHTFSRRVWRDQVASWTAQWVRSW